MNGWVILALYILGIPLWMLIEKKYFPFEEGDYHIEFDGAHEITPEIWKCDVVARAGIWPICLAATIMLLPFKLLDILFEKL